MSTENQLASIHRETVITARMEGECPLLLSLKRVEKLFNQKGTFGGSFYLIG